MGVTILNNLTSIKRSLQLLSVIAVFVTSYFAKDLILPILLGFLLALTLSPLMRTLGRAGVPSGPAAVLVVGLSGIAGALIAVPFLVVFKVVCDNVASLQMISHFLDNETRTPPGDGQETARAT